MRRRRPTIRSLAIGTTLVLSTLVGASRPAWAAPGDPDRSFGGGDGWEHAGFGSWVDGRPVDDLGEDLVVQPNGRIVMLGMSHVEDLYRLAIIRFLPDGSPDPSFGARHSGRIYVGAPSTAYPMSIALQPNGGIVVTAAAWHCPLLVFRYEANGTRDRSFGENGRVTICNPQFLDINVAIAVQSDGNILLSGSAFVADQTVFALVRLLPDGRIDGSFGHEGVASVELGNSAYPGDVALGARGRILVGGTVVRSLPSPARSDDGFHQGAMVVARLHEDGTLDRTFGRGGRTVVRFFPRIDDQYKRFDVRSLALQGDGSLILGGEGYSSRTGYVSAFARLRRSGELDRTFGTRGRLIPRTVSRIVGVADLVIDDVDRIYAAVRVQEHGAPRAEAGVIRLLPDGEVDETFGSDGLATMGLRRETTDRGIALTQGRLILGGSAFGEKRWRWDFALSAFRI